MVSQDFFPHFQHSQSLDGGGVGMGVPHKTKATTPDQTTYQCNCSYCCFYLALIRLTRPDLVQIEKTSVLTFDFSFPLCPGLTGQDEICKLTIL